MMRDVLDDDSHLNQRNEPLLFFLKTQVIPVWERFGWERLAVSAATLEQFQLSMLPDLVRVSVKKRLGKRTTARSERKFNNASSFLEAWPSDDQGTFRYPALVYVCAGQADFRIADYMVHCPQDHFFLFRTRVPRPLGHRPHLEGDGLTRKHCTVLWFFAPPGTNSVVAYLCHSRGEQHSTEAYHIVHRPEVLHTYKLVIGELEANVPADQKIAALSVQTFLHLFLRELQQGRFRRAGQSSAPVIETNAIAPIEEAQLYIKTHLNRPLTAAHVAGQVYMSRNSFMHHFARATGQTFHDYVIEHRMEEARRLLGDGHWSIAVIANFVGLRPTQFRAQFKKRFGVSPSHFRRSQRELGETGD